MYYEINVHLNNRHFFATAERSLTTEAEARWLYLLFQQKFPASEGYGMTVQKIETTGLILDTINW